MRLPDSDTHFAKYARKGYYQRQTILMGMARVKEWDCAVDIGGHCGFASKDMAPYFGTVHTFEPVKENYDCLVENVPSNVVCHNMALGERFGTVTMNNPAPTNSGAWEAKEGGDVEMRPLDSFDFQRVGFIKIDVQGFEMAVLKGAVETIKRWKPTMVLECNKQELRSFQAGGEPPETIRFLFDLGLTPVYVIRGDVVLERRADGV